MLEIDPQLRGQEDEHQQQHQQQEDQQQHHHLPEASTNSYIYPPAAEQITSTAPHVSESDRAALVQSLTAEDDDLPYYEGQQLQGLPTGGGGGATASASVYQPITFTPHEPRKRPRSCESCRGLKVKCEPNESGTGPCKRCAKAGRECLYTESSGRRKKKEDNKVKELEQKVNGLTAALLAQRGAAASESLIYDDDSILHNNAIGEDEGPGRKRRRSEFEGDGDNTDSPLTINHKVMTASSLDLDLRDFDGLAKQKATSDFCANLKFLEAWFQEYRSHASNKSVGLSAEVNGAGKREKAGKAGGLTNGSHNTGNSKATGSSKAAPTAQMVRSTPLDLLSQVASNEQPSAANQTQSEWYSPYASATQDTSGYYDLKQEDGAGAFQSAGANGNKSELEELFYTEFGNRASLVMNFLNTFVAGSGMKHEE